MKELFKKWFGCGACSCENASQEDEIAAAIAVALQCYSQSQTARYASKRRMLRSDWSNKSFGMTAMPQRNKKW